MIELSEKRIAELTENGAVYLGDGRLQHSCGCVSTHSEGSSTYKKCPHNVIKWKQPSYESNRDE